MKACPLGSQASSWLCVRLGRAFSTASSTEAVECMMPAHVCGCSRAAPARRDDGVLPGLPRRCAARSAEAAHAAASSSYEPPRKPWRGPCALYFGYILGSVLLPMCVVRCAVHGICVLSVDTRAIVLVEKSTVIRIATVMISRIEYDVVTNTIL